MMKSPVTDPILWRTASRFHDWMQGDVLRTFLERWLRDGVIGVPETIETNEKEKPFAASTGTVVDKLLAIPIDKRGFRSFAAKGNEPHPWWVSVWIPPYDAEVKRNDGYGMINLFLPRAAFAGRARSELLLNAFELLYTPDNCEFAGIHPEHHLGKLQMKEYETALTVGPMFAGMFWANFLGPGHVERFRPEVIDALPVFRRKWIGSKGVFLIASEDVATADSPENERKLVAMTEQLRQG
jgi:hypothetical protein